jgi:hypothetical protein
MRILIFCGLLGGLAFLPCSSLADEGGNFETEDEPTMSALSTVKQRLDIVSNTRWNIQGLWRKQSEWQGALSSISTEDSWSFDIVINGESFLWFRDAVRLSIDGGVRMTNEGRKEFQKQHPSVTSEDARYMTFFKPGFREFSLYYKVKPSWSIEAGLLPLKLGNALFVNPINYVERFMDDSSQVGADTFPGLKTFYSFAQHSFSLTYIPKLFQQDESSYASDIFQLGKTQNLAILQSNHYVWNGRLSFLGVLEERDRATSSRFPYCGIGGEAQIPFASWVLNAQTLFSNGDARFALQHVESGGDIAYFLPDADSRDEFFLEAFALATVPVFASKIEVSLGYWFNERGLTGAEQDDLFLSLLHASHLAALGAASGVGDWALSYTRHVGILNLSYPRVTDHLGINNLVFLNLLDGSGKLQSVCFYDLSEMITMDLGAMLNFGKRSSLQRMEFLNASLTFGMTLYF